MRQEYTVERIDHWRGKTIVEMKRMRRDWRKMDDMNRERRT